MADIPEFSVQTLTETVNLIKGPSNFLMNLCFPQREAYETETVRVDTWDSGRDMEDFSDPDGPGTYSKPVTKSTRVYSPPTMQPKLAFSAQNLLRERQPGEALMIGPGQSRTAAIRDAIAKDVSKMIARVDNREEWMCGKAFTPKGAIGSTWSTLGTGFDWTPAGDTNFSIDYPIPEAAIKDWSGSSDRWDTATNDVILDHIEYAEEFLSENSGGALTHIILGKTVGTAIQKNTKFMAQMTAFRGLDNGALAPRAMDRFLGARRLGMFRDFEIWVYLRQLTDNAGNTAPILPAKNALFVSVTPEAQRGVKYAAVPDIQAIFSNQFKAQRYADSWYDVERRRQMERLFTRPLPCMPNPNTFVVAQVIG